MGASIELKECHAEVAQKVCVVILYGFKKYPQPRKALFLVDKEDGGYSLPGGWETELEEILIIGESNNCFVHRLLETERGEWVGKKVVKTKLVLPIGVHKSRLVRWTSGQLEIF
jgi:hypothetical protein